MIEHEQYKLRTGFVFLFFLVGYLFILVNVFVIQIYHHHFYIELADKQYHVTVTTTPPRAQIIDRNGTPLAINKQSVAAFITPHKLQSPETLKPFLQEHFPNAYKRLQKNKNKKFMYVQRKLTDEQIKLIAQSNIADIHVLHEPNRFYPTAAAGPIVGITNIDNKGAFGVELLCNKQLTGKKGSCVLQKDARSGHFYFEKEYEQASTKGEPVQLTIDNTLQFLAGDILQNYITNLQAQEGAAVILDPQTGEILAMVTAPTFNPNNAQQLNLEHTKNKVITETYELGSVMKVFAALAALEEGLVTPEECVDCKGKRTAYIDGRKINTVKAHDTIPFKDVVAFSNNIGIAQVTKRLQEKLYDHYTKIGFGTKTGIDFPGEQAGFINHPANWSKQSIFSLSYGYELNATLLQLARAFAVIANNGYPVQPKLFMNNQSFDTIPDGITQDERGKASKDNNSQNFVQQNLKVLSPNLKNTEFSRKNNKQSSSAHPEWFCEQSRTKLYRRIYSVESIKTIKDILRHTTEKGTTRRAAIKGYNIMSKTGTANLLVNGKYDEHRNIFTCAGIIEKDDYQRILVVFVKEVPQNNTYASIIAAPLFEKIAEKMLIHDKVIT